MKCKPVSLIIVYKPGTEIERHLGRTRAKENKS